MTLTISIHEHTGIEVIDEVPTDYRLMRKCTLGNNYGLYYDLFGNTWYVSPEAERRPRPMWEGCITDGIYHIYLKKEYEDS